MTLMIIAAMVLFISLGLYIAPKIIHLVLKSKEEKETDKFLSFVKKH